MQKVTFILLGLMMLAYAVTQSQHKTKPSRFQHLKGWEKLIGVLAVICTLLIVLNPEFLAFGFIGDAAFFDVLVLAISLQMHLLVRQAFRRSVDLLSRGVRAVGIPSPGLRYCLFVSTLVIGTAVAGFQKTVHRIFS